MGVTEGFDLLPISLIIWNLILFTSTLFQVHLFGITVAAEKSGYGIT